MTIKDYKNFYLTGAISRFTKTKDEKKSALNKTLEKIKFLESIYMTGGNNNFYSKGFEAAAVRERDELCKESSALNNLINNFMENPKKCESCGKEYEDII